MIKIYNVKNMNNSGFLVSLTLVFVIDTTFAPFLCYFVPPMQKTYIIMSIRKLLYQLYYRETFLF
jgi:hypothetical protein